MKRNLLVLILAGLVSLMGLADGAVAATQPGDIPDLLMWLKADAGLEDANGDAVQPGGSISTWKDQSGNGWDATSSDPRSAPKLGTNAGLKGAAVVTWAEGVTHDDDGNPLANGPVGIIHSGFSVDNGSLADGQEATYVVVFDGHEDVFNRRLLNFVGPGEFRNHTKGIVGDPKHVGPFSMPMGYVGSINIHHKAHYSVLRQRFNDLDHWVDGIEDTMSVFYNIDEANHGDGDYELGAVNDLDIGVQTPNGNPFVGDMAEIMIFGRGLSDGEIAGLQGYMFQKYGLPEPSSLTLFALGGMVLALRSRRRRR